MITEPDFQQIGLYFDPLLSPQTAQQGYLQNSG